MSQVYIYYRGCHLSLPVNTMMDCQWDDSNDWLFIWSIQYPVIVWFNANLQSKTLMISWAIVIFHRSYKSTDVSVFTLKHAISNIYCRHLWKMSRYDNNNCHNKSQTYPYLPLLKSSNAISAASCPPRMRRSVLIIH